MTAITRFQKGLKTRHISLIALGGIIGSSYFLGTGHILNQVGPGAFLAYALGGLITFLTLMCLTEMAISVPKQGSFVGYAAHYISPTWACGVGWSYWISWIVYIPSECIAAGIFMHNFVPEIPVYGWAAIFGMVVTLINISHVKAFGEVEFWLSIIKVLLLVGFSVLAFLIFFGYIGVDKPQIIGTEYLLKKGGLFPNGVAILFVNMVILLANFQGSEIIGITASESEFPEKAIPAALKKMPLRIIGLYLIPTFLLALIFPWQEANLTGSVFSFALNKYGLIHIAHGFSFLLIAGALSCANSGLYATVRSLHALSRRKMAPQYVKQLNQHGVPARATFFSLGAIWIMLAFSYFLSAHQLYANLLALSGFTGAVCWISICWSQLRFRKKLMKRRRDISHLKYKIPFFPYLTIFAIYLQVVCLLFVLWTPDLRASFYFGFPALVIPMLIYKYTSRKKKFFSI